jgi:lysophospholipase L1-like esterase
MTRGRIACFLFAVIALLAVLCAVFPSEGLLGLRFPRLGEVLSGPGPKGPTPEELLEQRRQAVLAAERDEFLAFFEADPARFYLPDDDPAFFDSLFVALDSATRTPLRIIHYGDSQIEEDRISGTIRSRLQARFGGSGPGMMPAREYATRQVGGGASVALERFFIFGDPAYRAGIRQYGPYGDFVRLDTAAVLSYYPVQSRGEERCTFDQVTLVAGNLRSDLHIRSRGDTLTAEPGEPLVLARFALPDSSRRASLTVSGYADLYGVLLDGKSGVRLDNVAMRGSGGTFFTAMDAAQLRAFFEQENVRLLLLQFGGNSIPMFRTDKAVSDNLEAVRRQIRYLQGLAPQAKIVFIGPSDMSTTVRGRLQTYPRLPAFVDSLKQSATQCGAAYWDIYGAMGGENSMQAWGAAKPPLAGPDFIHFTLAGAKRVGEMFCDSFFLYYDYYRWRKEHEN